MYLAVPLMRCSLMAAAFRSGGATADWPPPDVRVQLPLTGTTSGMGLVPLPSVMGPVPGNGPGGRGHHGRGQDGTCSQGAKAERGRGKTCN